MALERISGKLAGKSGIFAVQHGARRDAAGQVLKGSGTGKLRGIRGQAEFAHRLMTLEYSLE